jgi:hypothetical protein
MPGVDDWNSNNQELMKALAYAAMTPEQRAEHDRREQERQELITQYKGQVEHLSQKIQAAQKRKPILCLDFDGVCHSYTSGWKGADVIPDPPVPGLFEFLWEAKELFDIQVFSSRSHQDGGIEAMWRWFGKHNSDFMHARDASLTARFGEFQCPDWISFPTEKPPAHVSIDDRGVTFEGTWPDVAMLLAFKPWNKR